MVKRTNKDMLRIAVVVLGDIFAAHGTTVRVQRVLDVLHKRYDITVINCSNKNQRKLKGMEDVHVITLKDAMMNFLMSKPIHSPLKVFYSLSWNPKLFFFLLRNRFDVIYCAWDFLGFFSIYLVSKIKKYKTIFEAHSIYSEDIKAAGCSIIRLKLSQILERFAVRHSDFVIALSRNTVESYCVYNSEIDLVPVFLDTDVFRAEGRSHRTDLKLVGIIGPFDTGARGKYYLDFLYKNIERFDRRIRFVVIGRCEERMQNERIEYTGYVDSVRDYIDQLCSLDTVLVPEAVSTTGPLNKLLEPMSCSIPVFTTPKGIVGLYWSEPGKDVLVFEEDELVNKVNELIFDDELMAQIGRNARKVVDKYYSKKATEEKLVRIMELMAERQHTSRLS